MSHKDSRNLKSYLKVHRSDKGVLPPPCLTDRADFVNCRSKMLKFKKKKIPFSKPVDSFTILRFVG